MKILSDEIKESKLNMNIDDLLSSIIEGCKYILSKGNIRFNLSIIEIGINIIEIVTLTIHILGVNS